MNHTTYKKLPDMLHIELFQEKAEHKFEMTSLGGPKLKTTIKKDAVVIQTKEFTIKELLNYEAAAIVVFHYGKGYSKSIAVYSKPITIFSKG